MPRLRASILAAVVKFAAGAMLAPSDASATAFCPPRQTRDGFVALRESPSPTAKLIGRMKSDDEVQLGSDRKGIWIEVTWWRGDDRLSKGFDTIAGRGWVHRDLIGKDCG